MTAFTLFAALAVLTLIVVAFTIGLVQIVATVVFFAAIAGIILAAFNVVCS